MNDDIYRFVHYYFEQGGVINVLIFITAIVIFYITLDKLFVFAAFSRQLPDSKEVSETLLDGTMPKRSPASFQAAFSDISVGMGERPLTFYQNRFREVLIIESDRLERGLSTMAVWINAAPLLGLFGTVIGMTQTFGVITAFGIGNPTLLSEGISLSLITTQTGLIVAFPGLIIHNILTSKKEKLMHRLVNLGETAFRSKGDIDAF